MSRNVPSTSTLAIVATTRFLLLVDLEQKNVIPLEANRPEYYGVSWQPGSTNLTLSHSGIDNALLVDISTYAQSEVGWISQANASSPPFLSQPHQVLCASDGRVICTNTGRNAISVIDLAKPSHFQEVGISSARWDRLSLSHITGDHLNSVYEKNGFLYVIAHRHSKGSALATFSYPDLKLIELKELHNRSGLHNIWVNEEGQQISCHSEAGSVIDLVNNEVLWEAGSPIYTRGLAATNEIVLVGESQKTVRDLRGSSMSGLWIIDRNSWKAIDYLCLGPYGAVNEVRLLNVPDEAHHRHPFAGTENLLSQSLLSSMKNQRMSATYATEKAFVWKKFDLIFGAPTSDENGSRYADGNNLCLVVKKTYLSQNTALLKFSYTFDQSAAQAHVSCVIDYKGNGGDTNMTALLIQPAGDKAQLSLWNQDGMTWSVTAGVSVRDLPISGHVIMTMNETAVDLNINGIKVITLPTKQFHIEYGTLGIRWIGAHIKPDSDVA
jgi:hypothetical protein